MMISDNDGHNPMTSLSDSRYHTSQW
jgi:hypothetical protein